MENAKLSFVPVTFREEDVPLAMSLADRLRRGEKGLKAAVLTLLGEPETPAAADAPADTEKAVPFLQVADAILRGSEAGRKAVLTAMAKAHGQEVPRSVLLEAYGKAVGRIAPTPYHLVGILSGITRSSAKKGFPHRAFETRWDQGRDAYFYRMNPLLANAIAALPQA
jgi:hypothetical protein